MAIVKQVLHGNVTMDDTTALIDITLSPSIDKSKSFLMFGLEQSENAPKEDAVSGRIIDGNTIRFERHEFGAGDADIVIRYHVVEFESGVSVQHGTLASFVDGANDVTLGSAVDPGRAFALLSYHAGGDSFRADDFYRAEILSSTTLRITVDDSGASNYFVAWQVVEFVDSSVQAGTVSFGTGETVKTDTLGTTVDPDKTWLSMSLSTDFGSSANMGQKMVRGEISTDGTTLTFTRENSGQTLTVAYFLVEFTDDTTVQRGTTTLSSSQLEKLVSLTAVDPERALPVMAGVYDRGGSSAFASNDIVGVATAGLEFLADGATLAIRRGTTESTAATFEWQVIEFDAQATGSSGGSGTLGTLAQEWVDDNDDLRVRFTEEGQIQVGDFNAGVLSTADALIEAHRAEGSSLPQRGLHTLGKIAGAVSTAISWMVGELELVGTAAISSIHSAIRGRLTHSSSGDSSDAELRAGDFETINQSGTSGTPVGTAIGVQGTVNNQEDAYLTKASGVVAKIQNATGADIETAVALEVAPPVNDGTIDTLIGLDIPDMNEGTENYALRTGEGVVSLGDVLDVPVVTTSPAAPAAGKLRVYFKLDGSSQPELYARASIGTEYKVTLT